MAKDNIPSKDALFDIFQEKFVKTVTVNQILWAITLAALGLLTGAQTPWKAAWLVAKEKDSRTKTDVKAKNTAKKKFIKVLRPFIQQWIQNNELVTDADRVSMGIKPRDTTHTSVPEPSTVPQIDMYPGKGNSVKVFFKQEKDAAGVSHRGKPEGVNSCEMWYKLGGTAPVTEAEYTGRINATRSAKILKFTLDDRGKTLYLIARWVNRKQEAGMWCAPQSIVVPG